MGSVASPVSEVTAISIGPRSHAIPSGGLADVLEIPDLAALHDAAARTGTRLVWLVDARAAPSQSTLSALLEHADAPAVSVPVDARGALVEAALGRVADEDPATLLERVVERRVPLRHTTVTSLVIERELVATMPPPNPYRFGPYAGTEWTARVFAESPGMLVPASRVEVVAPPPGSLAQAVRMAGSGSWRRGEALRELHRVVVGR